MSETSGGPLAPRVLIIGAGRVGMSLAADLGARDAFGAVTVIGRRRERPEFLTGHPSVGYAAAGPRLADAATELVTGATAGAPPGAGSPSSGNSRGGARPPPHLIFAVPDDALELTARVWAEAVPADGGRGAVALHTSGVRPGSALEPLGARCGYALGSWHPLAALGRPREGAFEGVAIGVEGEEPAVTLGERIASRIGARPVRLAAGSKARYHAAAVFASNYLVACLHAATEELRAAGAEATEAALLPLARSALDSVERLGLVEGTTGPLTRGDARTIEAHVAALDPSRRELYRALGRELLAMISVRIDAPTRERLVRALGFDPEGGRENDA